MFENIWKVKSMRKDVKEKDKKNYYDIFLDGYGCAIISLEEKQKKDVSQDNPENFDDGITHVGKEFKAITSQEFKRISKDPNAPVNQDKKVTMHEVHGEPNDEGGKHLACEDCGFCKHCNDCKCQEPDKEEPKVKREYEICKTCRFSRQAHSYGNTKCKDFQEPDKRVKGCGKEGHDAETDKIIVCGEGIYCDNCSLDKSESVEEQSKHELQKDYPKTAKDCEMEFLDESGDFELICGKSNVHGEYHLCSKCRVLPENKKFLLFGIKRRRK